MKRICEHCEGTAANVNHMSWLHVPHQKGTEQCIANLRAAIAHERDRAKRVVLVFWRVKFATGLWHDNFRTLKEARRFAGIDTATGTVWRVTVRRKAK